MVVWKLCCAINCSVQEPGIKLTRFRRTASACGTGSSAYPYSLLGGGGHCRHRGPRWRPQSGLDFLYKKWIVFGIVSIIILRGKIIYPSLWGARGRCRCCCRGCSTLGKTVAAAVAVVVAAAVGGGGVEEPDLPCCPEFDGLAKRAQSMFKEIYRK